jgi:hypothetical protein
MADNALEEEGQPSLAENECESDEIDIVSHSNEHEISEIKQEYLPDERQNCDLKSKQASTFAAGSKKTARFSNAVVDSSTSEPRERLDIKEEREFSCNSLDKVQFTSMDEGMPDENDVYKRFYFESDHLALKDNAE